jgi:UDP-GlcNAc:undecaprenyl-phosphate GlcNAc-1-phosphate transferase
MIHSDIKPLLIFLVAFFMAMFLLPRFSKIAEKINLMDQPNKRKVHDIPKPLVGGLGFVLSACFAAAIFVPAKGLRGFFAGLTLMLVVGFFDDLKELGHRQKFIAQIIAALLLIYFSHVRLVSFGNILGMGELIIPVYWLSVVISIFCLLGVINAINLIDGLDGLAGGISFVAFLILAAHASFADNQTFLLLNLAFAGATLAFLYFNWYPAKLFMGDAGSLCLGFTLSFMAIAMTQGDTPCMPPIAALLILSIPISDTLTIMTKRIIQGKSPFHPDKRHLHHIFMSYGLSRENTVKIIIGLSAILGSISLLGPIYNLGEHTLFLLFALYFVLYFTSSFFILDLVRYRLRFQRKRNSCGHLCSFFKIVFQLLDKINLIRKDARYDVKLPMQCCITTDRKRYRGTIVNISKSGFMCSIPELTTLRSLFLADISFETHSLKNDEKLLFNIEHLWISTLDNSHIHGFQFSSLTPEQKRVLYHYINELRTRPSVKINAMNV